MWQNRQKIYWDSFNKNRPKIIDESAPKFLMTSSAGNFLEQRCKTDKKDNKILSVFWFELWIIYKIRVLPLKSVTSYEFANKTPLPLTSFFYLGGKFHTRLFLQLHKGKFTKTIWKFRKRFFSWKPIFRGKFCVINARWNMEKNDNSHIVEKLRISEFFAELEFKAPSEPGLVRECLPIRNWVMAPAQPVALMTALLLWTENRFRLWNTL
jgi:hypothetical protein